MTSSPAPRWNPYLSSRSPFRLVLPHSLSALHWAVLLLCPIMSEFFHLFVPLDVARYEGRPPNVVVVL